MNRTRWIRSIAALLLLAGLAMAQQNPKLGARMSQHPQKGPSESDQAFMKRTAIGNAAEVQLGTMAQQKGSAPAVKQFGQRMVRDHSKADQQLKAIAQQQNVGLPNEIDPPHKAEKSGLSKKTGGDFDQNYMRLMVQDHTKTIAEFKHEIASSNDPQLKQYAQATLPILQSHLQQARQVQAQLGGEKKP